MLYQESPKSAREVESDKLVVEAKRDKYFNSLAMWGWISIALTFILGVVMKVFDIENTNIWMSWNSISTIIFTFTWGQLFILKVVMTDRNVFGLDSFNELSDKKMLEVKRLVEIPEMLHWKPYIEGVKDRNRKLYSYEYNKIKEDYKKIFSDYSSE